MYSINDFTKKAVSSLKSAVKAAEDLGHTFIGSEHMLLGFLNEGSNVAYAILKNNNVTAKKITQYIRQSVGEGIPSSLSDNNMTPTLRQILSDAVSDSRSAGVTLTGTEYILGALLKKSSCSGVCALKSIGVNINKLTGECAGINSIESSCPALSYCKIDARQYPYLTKYSKNLTDTAYENGFDPVIGRETEIERVIQILSRKTKNNPCLLGEAGVGKTAIVEGLAQLIVSNNVPFQLKNKSICALDIPAMLAGAKYRGDFEERIKNCIDEVAGNKSIILFIDEIHTIVGAGAAEGAIDAANILKPQLARGQLQIIGATTYEEYHKFIEKDSALERRFQPVTVNEPDHKQLFNILTGIKSSYENYHMVNISDEIINEAIKLSERYIHDRYLPDKAIDVIDEACSYAIIRSFRSNSTDRLSKNDIKTVLKKNMSDLKISTPEDTEIPDVSCRIDVTVDDVSHVISGWTGIPLSTIMQSDNSRLLCLEEELNKHIIGQKKAISSLAEAIRRNQVGLKEQNRPIGSFLFVGPTGVGKTELSKVLAKYVFDSEKNIIRLDMSEYMEKHSAAKIIGAPPGYVGFRESGQLCDEVRKKPYAVILFDEVEKAHPDILNLLLQITEDGVLKDSQGKRADFKNCLIILTSNIGSSNDSSAIGFEKNDNPETKKKEITEELKKYFRPELLNRMDDIIIFEPLSFETLKDIASLFLRDLIERARNINLDLEFSDDVCEYLAKNSQSDKNGARPLKRMICNKIENSVTKHILENKVSYGSRIYVDIYKNNIRIEVKSEETVEFKT
ncbi:MAG: ATP-dependent Clp protease ATP-binding subunit [Oscillospiraceae bacterium]|nr:ATP-dependent Clp protease ATP-binding subunit [Oscillospiraceae bacterium]